MIGIELFADDGEEDIPDLKLPAVAARADDVDACEAAGFISATLVAIKVSARAGASPENLRGIARMALRSLQ